MEQNKHVFSFPLLILFNTYLFIEVPRECHRQLPISEIDTSMRLKDALSDMQPKLGQS